MRKIIVLVFLLFITNSYADSEGDSKLINTTIQNLMHKRAIPGAAVVLYKDGKPSYYYFGTREEGQDLPVNINSIFEIGSITKTFTGLLLAQGVDSGKLSFTDAIPFEGLSKSFKKVTLLNLATFSASLPYDLDYIPYNAVNSNKYQALLDKFMSLWRAGNPIGSHFAYSNLSFGILSKVIEYREKNKLNKLMQTQIFNPLKMGHTFFIVPESQFMNYAQGYDARDHLDRTPRDGLYAGSFALKSSVADMAKYLEACLLLPETPIAISDGIKVAQSGYYMMNQGRELGLGWFIVPLDHNYEVIEQRQSRNPKGLKKIAKPHYIPHNLIEKSGATNGFRAYIAVIPQKKIGIVILVNKFTYNVKEFDGMGRKLLIDLNK